MKIVSIVEEISVSILSHSNDPETTYFSKLTATMTTRAIPYTGSLHSEGEMERLMQQKDWSLTPVGQPETWPQSLRTALSIMLHSRFPMFLFWGPDLICFYNDAYRPSLGVDGKHPSILGMKAEEAWTEIWTIIKPLIDKVLSGGGATWSEDQLIPIYRNGKIEDVYWTFSYSPVSDESGKPSAVFVTCTETTEKVLNLKQFVENEKLLMSAIDEQVEERKKIEASEKEFRELADSLPQLVWTTDKNGNQTFASKRWKEFTGLDPQDAESFQKMVHPDDWQDITNSWTHALAMGTVYITEVRLKSSSGIYNWFFVNGEPIRNEKGEIEKWVGAFTNINEQKKAEEHIKLISERFGLLADAMPQFVWIGDAIGNLNYFNKSVYRYSGLSTKEIEENGWLQIVHPDDREENMKQWQNSIATGKEFVFSHRFRRHDGEYRWQLSRAIPQKDTEGNIQLWVGSSTDIQELKELDQQKDNFLSMASHELRTPVTTIKAYGQIAESMLQKKGDIETLGMIQKMSKQVNRLTTLIEDLLDISKIQKGKLMFDESLFDFSELLFEVSDDMQKSSTSHRIKVSSDVSATMFGAKDKIGQVLNNLISNAIKYSPSGAEVIINAETENSGIHLSIQDFGIGISPQEQANVFKQFYRVSGGNQTTFPGMGIGLYICSEIIKEHGGKIWVESKVDNGSTFHVWMPFDHRIDSVSMPLL